MQASTLSDLLDTALELAPEQRAAWIDSLGEEHAALKPRLRALLARAAEVESRDFLGSLPGLPLPDTEADTEPALDRGAMFGPYRLERPLGAGGMGSVWLAQRADGLFDRHVALKLPHRGLLGVSAAQRLAQERTILAGLQHPNIAQLLDAGVTQLGQPYLALEYIDGMAIDRYCARHDLDVDARLRLVLQVAEALAHAHARLVVHRDLKPANILVTDAGQVKLLDFGIAKLLADDDGGAASPLTRVAGRVLTPDYASPEQIRGALITTSTDIYSLGVVLYELLTGARPYRLRRDTAVSLEAAILEAQSVAPSRMVASRSGTESTAVPVSARELRGDLDVIVLKALRKDAAERYPTVAAFADDLRRHLEGRPVVARPDSSWYRATRFIQRNRIAVAATTSVALALLAATVFSINQARIAIAERQRAEEVKTFIASIFSSADPFEGGGRSLDAVALLRQARTRVERDFAARPELRVELLTTIGWSLSNLSDHESADEVSDAALSLANRVLRADDPRRLEAQLLRLESHRFMGRAAQVQRELEPLLAQDQRTPFPAIERARLLLHAVHLAIEQGRGADAASYAIQARELADTAVAPGHPLRLESAVVLAVALRYANRFAEAEAAAERALALTLQAHGNDSTAARVIDARFALGSAYIDTGKAELAAREIRAAIDDARQLFGADSAFETFASSHLARALTQSDQLDAALVAIDHTLALTGKQGDALSRDTGIGNGLRAHILRRLGRPDEALRAFDIALPAYVSSLGLSHDATRALRLERALTLAQQGQFAAARAAAAEVAAESSTLFHWMNPGPRYTLGVIARIEGRCDEALPLLQASLQGEPGATLIRSQRRLIESEIARCRS
ncbi:MAG: protein kinase [Steroidobacteraceae bacterium]